MEPSSYQILSQVAYIYDHPFVGPRRIEDKGRVYPVCWDVVRHLSAYPHVSQLIHSVDDTSGVIICFLLAFLDTGRDGCFIFETQVDPRGFLVEIAFLCPGALRRETDLRFKGSSSVG